MNDFVNKSTPRAQISDKATAKLFHELSFLVRIFKNKVLLSDKVLLPL